MSFMLASTRRCKEHVAASDYVASVCGLRSLCVNRRSCFLHRFSVCWHFDHKHFVISNTCILTSSIAISFRSYFVCQGRFK